MYFFISDTHLGLQNRKADKERESLLLDFLDSIKPRCKTLFIVGDFFDFWFEYETVIPRNFYRTLAKLAEFKDSGIEIVYLMGNHDFGHNNFFEDEFGIEVQKNDVEIELEGKRFYLAHGDGKAHNDDAYLLLRKILRSKWANSLFRILHPNFGIALATHSSRKSRVHTDAKDYGTIDGLKDFAKVKIDDGFDYVIMGHRHKAEYFNYNQGAYINLGEWIKKPHFGFFDGNKFELIDVKAFLHGQNAQK